jgi:hypothetical protein
VGGIRRRDSANGERSRTRLESNQWQLWLDRLVRRCVEKNPASIADLPGLIRELKRSAMGGPYETGIGDANQVRLA